MTIYRIILQTEIDTGAGESSYSTAETIRNDVAQLAILKRWPFADTLRITVKKVEQPVLITTALGLTAQLVEKDGNQVWTLGGDAAQSDEAGV
jgi:hypothetical protein